MHGGPPQSMGIHPWSVNYNHFLTFVEIFHITIDYLHDIINMCGCIGMVELYLKNLQRVFSRTN